MWKFNDEIMETNTEHQPTKEFKDRFLYIFIRDGIIYKRTYPTTKSSNISLE